MDDFDQIAEQVDLQMWEAEVFFGDRDPLQVLREVACHPSDEAGRIMRVEAILAELGWPEP